MANIGTVLANWSTTEASNQPDSTDATTLVGDLRAIQAAVRYIYSQDTIASATTCDLGSKAAGSLTISGTTTITGLGTVSAGIRKSCVFSGILTLTHNGTSLILPGAANITTAANDRAEFESLGSGNWRCNWYQKDTGMPIVNPSLGMRNRLINPSGAIYQRAVAATADDAYFADRWYALTQTSTITPSSLTDPENGYPFGVRLTQAQAAAQRFGFAQIIESSLCRDMRNQSGTLVPRVRISSSQAVRYAILGWTSTADAVTSDVVADWTSASYTAGGFFLAANLSVLGVGSSTPSANTWTSLPALTASMGTTFNNVIVMVWTEGTAAQNVTLDFDFIQFERGAAATAFDIPIYMDDLLRCQRYYCKTFQQGTAPAQNAGIEGALRYVAPVANQTFGVMWKFPVSMRAAPTLTGFNPSAANANWSAGGVAITFASTGTDSTFALASGPTIAAGTGAMAHAIAEAEL